MTTKIAIIGDVWGNGAREKTHVGWQKLVGCEAMLVAVWEPLLYETTDYFRVFHPIL